MSPNINNQLFSAMVKPTSYDVIFLPKSRFFLMLSSSLHHLLTIHPSSSCQLSSVNCHLSSVIYHLWHLHHPQHILNHVLNIHALCFCVIGETESMTQNVFANASYIFRYHIAAFVQESMGLCC